MLTGIGDALSLASNFVFARAGRPPQTTGGLLDTDGRQIREILAIFSYIAMFENRWADLLYLQAIVAIEPTRAIFRPSDLEKATAWAVADHQTQMRGLYDACTLMELWKRGNGPGRLLKTVRDFELKKGRLRFSLQTPRPGRDRPPAGLITRHAIETAYVEDIIETELPNCPGATLNDILDAYEVLSSLGDVANSKAKTILAHREQTGAGAQLRTILAMAPKIRSSDLTELLEQAAGMERAKASAIIQFMTYRGRARDGVWAKPLVLLNDDGLVALVLETVLRPNHERLFDHWLIDGGIRPAERGTQFESHVRRVLADAVANNEILRRDAMVHREPANIGEPSRDADLLIRIRSTVFIGEVKCKAAPATPKDMHWHVREINRATDQVIERARAADTDRAKVASYTNFQGDPSHLRLVPFVLLNSPHGTGIEIKGVPVTDLLTLRGYLKDPIFHLGATTDGTERGARIEFYASAAQAEQRLPIYFRHAPPQVLRRFHALEVTDTINDPLAADFELIEHLVRVRLPETMEGTVEAVHAVKRDWELRTTT